MMKYVDEIICWLPTQKKTAEFETSEIFLKQMHLNQVRQVEPIKELQK